MWGVAENENRGKPPFFDSARSATSRTAFYISKGGALSTAQRAQRRSRSTWEIPLETGVKKIGQISPKAEEHDDEQPDK